MKGYQYISVSLWQYLSLLYLINIFAHPFLCFFFFFHSVLQIYILNDCQSIWLQFYIKYFSSGPYYLMDIVSYHNSRVWFIPYHTQVVPHLLFPFKKYLLEYLTIFLTESFTQHNLWRHILMSCHRINGSSGSNAKWTGQVESPWGRKTLAMNEETVSCGQEKLTNQGHVYHRN